MRCKRGVQGGVWAVQGGGKVRDPCVGRAGLLGRAPGGVGGALGAPRVDLGQLAPAEDQVEEGDVGPSSTGPQQKLGPGASGPSSPQDLSSRL